MAVLVSSRDDIRHDGIVYSTPYFERFMLDAMFGHGSDFDESSAGPVGTMFGLAVGNLLGLPVEGWSHVEISRRYPDGVREIDPREKTRPMDDDLAQAVELGEALLTGPGEPLISHADLMEDFAERLVRWLSNNGRGCGTTTWRVIELLEDGVPAPDAARSVYLERDRIAPNGAVMRCAPIAIYTYHFQQRMVEQSAIASAVTHFAPTCQWSCILINAVILLLHRGFFVDLPGIYNAALRDGMPDLLAQCESDGIPSDVFAAIANGEKLPESMDWLRVDQRLIGHTLLATQVGLWAAVSPMDFEEALVQVVSSGGDTDTNGAVAGAVLGARYGKWEIPNRWLDCVPEADRIENLAMRLGRLA